MCVYATHATLVGDLAATGLSKSTRDAILATARPTLLLGRELAEDDFLPVGIGKFGGFPDLPDSFAWPTRPPQPDAPARADRLAARAAEAHAADRPHIETRRAALLPPFPLGFVAQIDLGAWSGLAGFDPDLPRHGLLSLFADITGAGHCGRHWIVWHDGAGSLRRRRPPAELLAVDAAQRGSWQRPSCECTKAELLYATSAVTIPDHWQDQGFDETEEFVAALAASCLEGPALEAAGVDPAAPCVRDDEERFGGWPATLQYQHPETRIPVARGGGLEAPGRTPWRNLLCLDRDTEATRFMSGDIGSGDRICIMIHEDDLKALRFDATETIATYA